MGVGGVPDEASRAASYGQRPFSLWEQHATARLGMALTGKL